MLANSTGGYVLERRVFGGGVVVRGQVLVAVETIKAVNGLSSDDTHLEVLSGDTHHAARFRLQVGDATVNGIFLGMLSSDRVIASSDAAGSGVSMFLASHESPNKLT